MIVRGKAGRGNGVRQRLVHQRKQRRLHLRLQTLTGAAHPPTQSSSPRAWSATGLSDRQPIGGSGRRPDLIRPKRPPAHWKKPESRLELPEGSPPNSNGGWKIPVSAKARKRRGSTEARIAIPEEQRRRPVCRAKGFDNRATAVGWGRALAQPLVDRPQRSGNAARERGNRKPPERPARERNRTNQRTHRAGPGRRMHGNNEPNSSGSPKLRCVRDLRPRPPRNRRKPDQTPGAIK